MKLKIYVFYNILGAGCPPRHCQLCNKNLVGSKVYYVRNKICLEHSQADCCTVDGRPQRWCQQCCRFQDIDDFEGNHRTCKHRLSKHNERRRQVRASHKKNTAAALSRAQRRRQKVSPASATASEVDEPKRARLTISDDSKVKTGDGSLLDSGLEGAQEAGSSHSSKTPQQATDTHTAPVVETSLHRNPTPTDPEPSDLGNFCFPSVIPQEEMPSDNDNQAAEFLRLARELGFLDDREPANTSDATETIPL